MTLRCLLDGLLLPAILDKDEAPLIAFDGQEAFAMEAVEAIFYEVVEATALEMIQLELANYRLLRRADDFQPTT